MIAALVIIFTVSGIGVIPTIYSVSYTHLDVYKRQPMLRAIIITPIACKSVAAKIADGGLGKLKKPLVASRDCSSV